MTPRERLAADLAAAGCRPLHRLGQNFMVDPAAVAALVSALGPADGATVVEIGPGTGILTRALLASELARLTAIDPDPRSIAALASLRAEAPGRLALIHGDALDLDLATVGERIVIVANLPYNIATELLLRWLARLDLIERMVLMFQREVAQRLVAAPGSAAYGRLGVLAQRLCRVERLFDLSPGAFVPPPKVWSSVVRLTPRPDRPDAARRARLEAVTRAAFGQRRKMLRGSLGALGVEPRALLAAAGIDPQRRAETLDLDELDRLAEALGRLSAASPGRGTV